MQFVYHPQSGQEILIVQGEVYNYIFKVRRHKKGEVIAFRNMQDGYLYFYRIDVVDRRKATLLLARKEYKEVIPKKFFHLLWCVVDPKTIEKTLPMLNELGVGKISFVYCARSQKNFRLNLDKFQKILINSSQQCGRSRLLELEILQDFQEALEKYTGIVLIDFSDDLLSCSDGVQRAFIGPEGGITPKERERFTQVKGLDTPLVLRSETAAVSVSAKVMV